LTRVVGVDACAGGWVAVTLVDGRFDAADAIERFDAVVGGRAAVLGVDIPLGSIGADRAADRVARRLLGPRRASVFTPPPASVLDAPDYATANHACRTRYGQGLSIQAWNLAPKMRDALPAWEAQPDRVFEVHPELSFRAMQGAPLPLAKRSVAGRQLRAELLAGHGVRIPDEPGLEGFGAADDLLDAAAVAWSADRIARGEGECEPDPPEPDAHGRPVAIWF
jgi:predicted RNase H-like nuclease